MSSSSSPIPFPSAPATPSLANGTIPVPPTSLLGRDRELREVSALLDRDDLRMVTLLGPGGVGKTRLAVEIASDLRGMFANGAVMVPLEAIRDAALVPEAVARAFGLRPSLGTALDELLIGHLKDRHLLLVLDNLEQVIDVAPWLANVLDQCRRLRVLATSRRPLGIAGEQRYPVDPLPIPDDADPRTAAVALFIERARALDPAFEPDPSTIAVIAEICRRLDGLPLAIELAAARTSALSPEALLARLTHRFSLLSTGHPEAPARLRSMRDAVGWSYELLTPEAQRLFRRLSVFLGGFALDAVAFVATWPAAPGSELAGLHALQPLLDQSLVLPLREAGEPRFRMLETIREFGRQADAGDDAERAHAEYFVALTEPAPRALIGPDQVAWLDRLDAEFPNLRQAITWLAASERLGDAIEVVARIAFFLNIRGHVTEALQWLEVWLGRAEVSGPTRARGLALGVYGGLQQNAGPLAQASNLLGQSIDILAATGDRWYEAQFRSMRGSVHAVMGDLEGMREHASAALPTALDVGHHRAASASLSDLAEYALTHGDPATARRLQDDAWRIALDAGDVWLTAYRHVFLARDGMISGRLDAADEHALEALRLFGALGSQRDLPGIWDTLASIALLRGDLDLADEHLAAGLHLVDRAGGSGDASKLRETQGLVATERGDLARSAQSLARSLDGVDPGHEIAHTCRALAAYALLAARAGDVDNAIVFLGGANIAAHRGGLDPYHLPGEDLGPWLQSRLQSELGDTFLVVNNGDTTSIEDIMADALAYTPANPPPRPATPTFGLSRREMEVLRLMADGLSNQQIADALYVTLRTTATHVTSILNKLDLPSRTAAVAFAIRNGLA